jgi:3-phosphoshikimate 1-carboxyvinyltransferase
MASLLAALESLGVKCSSRDGKCPVSIKGPLKGGRARVEGKSSQFVSALLFAAPLSGEGVELEVFNLNERPYVEITLDWLDRQGIVMERSSTYAATRSPADSPTSPSTWRFPPTSPPPASRWSPPP